MLLCNAKPVTPEDMGWTQDEYNNFLIDMVMLIEGKYPISGSAVKSAPIQPPVTITITNNGRKTP